VLENCKIRGPVVIGQNCKISNCYIGPYTSISDNAELINSEIENSIVMNNVTIHNYKRRIDSSILGNNVALKNIEKQPKTDVFYLGENSTLILN
jgi:glucose-1-phosphate thymidylyltransferase